MFHAFPCSNQFSPHMMKEQIAHLRQQFFRFGDPHDPAPKNRSAYKGIKRFFKRGQLKFALLELLDKQSMHGYQMIKALEEKTKGFYSPSPGSIYPTLQLLEDQGYVTSEKVDGKNLYQITETGHDFLKANQTEEPFIHTDDCHELHHELRAEANEMRQLVGHAFRGAIQDPKQLNELLELMKKANKGLRHLIDPQQDE